MLPTDVANIQFEWGVQTLMAMARVSKDEQGGLRSGLWRAVTLEGACGGGGEVSGKAKRADGLKQVGMVCCEVPGRQRWRR